ncbi:MAG: bifunctional precorrin-2 dehydrogenase/sirohydrochlorin ferrochelatase [Candidatus Omnitrophica bacterium]|nr:bifunctional precorrin-2 dehydrogenase/sirohydrochlorin ferrochelatase [Candidatus Omnitrophota bacterium]
MRKVKALLGCNARVTLAGPRLCRGLEELKRQKAFAYKKQIYKRSFLRNKFLVIAATDQKELNAQIAKDARLEGVMVNVVDDPGLCSFYVPAVIRKGSLSLGISTGGVFPGMAKKIKREIAPVVEKYARQLNLVWQLRNKVRAKIKNPKLKKILIQKLLSPNTISLIKKKKIKRLEELLKYNCGN